MSIIQTIIQTSDLFFELTTNQTNLDIRTLIGNTLYNANYRKRVIIPSAVTVGSPSTTNAAIVIPTGLGGELVIDNYGSIQGAGGAAGGTGGDAIFAQSMCRINNKPTGTIYAGGGGGGTGGTGGTGGPGEIPQSPYTINQSQSDCRIACGPAATLPPRCPAGTISASCGFGGPVCPPATPSRYYTICTISVPQSPIPTTGGAGGAGGGGGIGRGYNQAPTTGSTGTAGVAGGTNAGTGGTGGTGGAGGDWGTPGDFGLIGNLGSNGNVGNGSAGSFGGAGGQAGYYINGLSTYVTLTNNGTVAGRTN